MRPCEREWSAAKGDAIEALLVELTGQTCPGVRGWGCRLVPESPDRQQDRQRVA